MPVAEGRAKISAITAMPTVNMWLSKTHNFGGIACFLFPSCILQRQKTVACELGLSNSSWQLSEVAVTPKFQARHVLQRCCPDFSTVVPFVGRRMSQYVSTHHSKLDIEFVKSFVFLSDVRLHACHLHAVGLHLGKPLLTKGTQTPKTFFFVV